jgi:hypothetical protein
MEMKKKKIEAAVAEIRIPESPAGRMGKAFTVDKTMAAADRFLENQ